MKPAGVGGDINRQDAESTRKKTGRLRHRINERMAENVRTQQLKRGSHLSFIDRKTGTELHDEKEIMEYLARQYGGQVSGRVPRIRGRISEARQFVSRRLQSRRDRLQHRFRKPLNRISRARETLGDVVETARGTARWLSSSFIGNRLRNYGRKVDDSDLNQDEKTAV